MKAKTQSSTKKCKKWVFFSQALFNKWCMMFSALQFFIKSSLVPYNNIEFRCLSQNMSWKFSGREGNCIFRKWLWQFCSSFSGPFTLFLATLLILLRHLWGIGNRKGMLVFHSDFNDVRNFLIAEIHKQILSTKPLKVGNDIALKWKQPRKLENIWC